MHHTQNHKERTTKLSLAKKNMKIFRLTSEADEATAIKATVAAKKDFMWTFFNKNSVKKGLKSAGVF